MPDATPPGWTQDDLARLLQESRDEVLAEVKACLKEHLLAGLLEHAATLTAEASPKPPARPVFQPLAVQPDEPTAAPASQRPKPSTPAWGYYVYGVTPNAPRRSLPAGIDAAHPITAVPYQALQALVSKVPLNTFGGAMLQRQVDDPDWLEQTVRVHQRIITRLQAQGPMLPMRFCTICHDDAGIRRFLSDNYDDFVQTLGILEEKQEWRVQIACDEAHLRRQMGAISDRAKTLRQKLRFQPEGTAHFLRTKLHEILTEEAAVFSKACTEHSHRMLSDVAEHATLSDAHAPAGTGRIMLDAAYLVRKAHWEAFRNRLELLQDAYGSYGFTFERTGPWPPHHFIPSDQLSQTDHAVALQ